MSGCPDSGRPGCRGQLCRSAHFALRKLPVIRYPAGEDDRPDVNALPISGWVCGLVSYRSAVGIGSVDIPGTLGGQQPIKLTVAAGSLEPPAAAGDRLSLNGQRLIVCAVSSTDFITAELIPVSPEEAE